MYGMGAFPSYMGDPSMYSVHKFMDLNPYQLGYFIQQVGGAALSFGVAEDDVNAVAMALETLFDMRCEPPMTVIPSDGPQLQSICIDGSCSVATNPSCNSYSSVMAPVNMTSGKTSLAPGSIGTSGNSPGNCTSTPTASHYGQCGGEGWTGPSVCNNGYTCTMFNPYYSQCT